MKRLIAMLLALAMLLSCVAFAEDADVPTQEELGYDSLTVGTTTPMSGKFFTDMWGNNSTDVDIRNLIHGYNLMHWNDDDGTYSVDESVVSGVSATEDAEGNRTYSVSLYQDLMYSDGTPITAWDYAFSILLYACPEVREIGGGTAALDYIVGMEEFRYGENSVITGVRVINDYLLNVVVSADYRPYFYELAVLNVNPYPISVIAPGCEMADDGEGVYIRNIDSSVTEPIFTAELLQETILGENGYMVNPTVTSGPYMLTGYDAEACTATFVINPNYKGDDEGVKPTIQNLTVVPVTNDNMMEKLTSDEVQLLNRVTKADSITEGLNLTSEDDYNTSNYARTGFTYISFCCEKDTVKDAAVRQALALAFDKDNFITDMVGNYGMRVEGYYGIGQWMYQMVNGTITSEEDMDAETQAAWEALSIDSIPTYNYDTAAAAALLEENGWKLNADGIREKDGIVLDLTLMTNEGNKAIEPLQTYFVDTLATIGVKVTIETAASEDVLKMYYRQMDRDADMFYLASNFSTVFNPALAFSTEEADQGVDNRTGIIDEKLYALAADISRTEPGDTLSYCQKWLEFQIRYAELLPSIPVYSNVYFDFYTNTLRNYEISEGMTWAEAIVAAYRSDAPDEVEETEEVEEDEFVD